MNLNGLLVLHVFHANGPPPFKQNARDLRVGLDRQVATVKSRPQIGVNRAVPLAIFGRHLIPSDTLLPCAIKVFVKWQSELPARADENLRDWKNMGHISNI